MSRASQTVLVMVVLAASGCSGSPSTAASATGSTSTSTAAASVGASSSSGSTVGASSGVTSSGPTTAAAGSSGGSATTGTACAGVGKGCTAQAGCCAGLTCEFGVCIPPTSGAQGTAGSVGISAIAGASTAGSLGATTAGSLGASTAGSGGASTAGSGGPTGASGTTGACLSEAAACTAQTCCSGLTCEFGFCIPGATGATGTTGATGATGTSGTADAGITLPGLSEYPYIVGDMLPYDGGGTVTAGGMTFTITWDAGAMYLTASQGTKLALTLAYLNGDDTQVAGVGYDYQGNVEYQFTSSFDGVSTWTSEHLTDTNDDGFFDRQDEWSVNTDGGLPYQMTETVSIYVLPDGGVAPADAGTWVQLWTYTGAASADAVDNDSRPKPRCNGYVGFPSDPSDTTQYTQVLVPKTNWVILESVPGNEGNGGCAQTDILTIQRNLQLALLDATQCLGFINRNQATMLETAKSNRLMIACGNTCSDTGVSTDLPKADFATANGFQRMNINWSNVGSWNDYGVEEFLLHEIIHVGGTNHNPPASGAPSGHDLVYGCGRYCDRQCNAPGATEGWGQGSVGGITPQEYAFDGTDCAEDQAKDTMGFLYDIDVCDNETCTSEVSATECNPGTICCNITEGLRCYADGAIDQADLGNRDPVSHKANAMSACVQSGGKNGCNDWPNADTCQVGWGVSLSPLKDDCGARPIGAFCL